MPALRDYLDEKRNLATVSDLELASYRTYQLNIAGGSELSLMAPHIWQNAAHPTGREEMEEHEGEDLYLGLDLSKARDLTAIGFNFPNLQLVHS